MSAWPLVPIKDFARVVGGATPKSGTAEYWDGDIPWTTPKDLSDLDSKYLSDTPRKITALGLKSCSSELLPPNSVLFSSRAPIGHVAINTVPMATNQGFKSFIPSPKLDASFLFWWLKCHRAQLELLGNGATFKEVSKAIVERVEIPLPPLNEQKRIAATLDQADELRRKRQRAIDRLNQLGQAIFHEMFGDPSQPKDNCTSITLSALTTKITDGEHQNPNFSDAGMPIVMASQVLEDRVDIANTKRVAFSDGEKFRKKCAPEVGDILIVGRGATIGRSSIVRSEIKFCLMGSVILIKPNSNVIKSEYLLNLLRHPYLRKKLFKTSSSSAQQAIYLSHIKDISLPVPSMELQIEFCDKMDMLRSIENNGRRELANLEQLLSSIQHRAFQGEL